MVINGFHVENWKNLKPFEDSYAYGKRSDGAFILIVADGITRDPKNMSKLPNKKNLLGMLQFFYNYPRPSPAKQAVDNFINNFIPSVSISRDISRNLILEGMNDGNKSLRFYNESLCIRPDTVDYLENDYAACVAAAALIDSLETRMIWASIADCRVRIFNSKGNITFESPQEGPNSKGSIDEDIMKKYQTRFIVPYGRRKIREEYRNNPQEPLSYGAFTGEKSALQYIKSGEQKINFDDRIIVHTDGVEEAVISGAFADALQTKNEKAMVKVCKKYVHSEGSLVYSF